MHQSPVWAPPRTPVGGVSTDTNPLIRNTERPPARVTRNRNHGVSLAETGVGAVDEAEISPLISLGPSALSPTSDNYCVCQTQLSQTVSKLDSLLDHKLNKTANFPVLDSVEWVHGGAVVTHSLPTSEIESRPDLKWESW